MVPFAFEEILERRVSSGVTSSAEVLEYTRYHRQLTREILTLRKQLKIQSPIKNGKYPSHNINVNSIESDSRSAFLLILEAERYWAVAMAAELRQQRRHTLTKLKKAVNTLKPLVAAVNTTDLGVYFALILGALYFRRQKWSHAYECYIYARRELVILGDSAKNPEVKYLYVSEQRGVVDPSLRTICRALKKEFADFADLPKTIGEPQVPEIQSLVDDYSAVEHQKFKGTTIFWRSHSVNVTSDIAMAVDAARKVEEQFKLEAAAKKKSQAAEKYDNVIGAWQDVVDAVDHDTQLLKEAVDPNLAIAETYAKFKILSYRVLRELDFNVPDDNSKLARISRILSSVLEAQRLPGVPRDEQLCAALRASELAYRAEQALVIANSHWQCKNFLSCLALASHAYESCKRAERERSGLDANESLTDLVVSPEYINNIMESAKRLRVRSRAMTVAQKRRKALDGVFAIEKLEYAVSDLDVTKLVDTRPLSEWEVRPFGTKPTFFDIAYDIVAAGDSEVTSTDP
ncbi:hypothetical protein CANCADRAFT_87209 [Tortispora caseinolytica NRRL Y-17796]|uniref:Signal recognition particle subunit SRP68 n=1 Tax=Tortispora caseinolytica NRRL Y-17796 TaxID=767744 RepID=A0A1E4TL48_9ASCO|nr:hypothetical protein CANCADRAFT_87209 [Tortispora caseinolytica NRRL Y-17796]